MRLIINGIVVLALAGCAGMPANVKSLTDTEATLANATEFNVFLNQQQLQIFEPNSNPYGVITGLTGYLVGAVIDEIKMNNAEKSAAQLLQALEPLNIADKVHQRLRTDVRYAAIPINLKPNFITEPVVQERQQTQRDMLELHARYGLSNNFDRLMIRIEWIVNDVIVKESRVSAGTRNFPKPDTAMTFTYIFAAPERAEKAGVSRRDEYAQAWLDFGVDAVAEQIYAGLDDLLTLLNADLGGRQTLSFSGEAITFKGMDDTRTKAYVFATEPGRRWAYNKHGYYVIAENAVLKSQKR